ncbi:CpaD family pilus assembly lipoprotein [Pelagibius marinus]|uniref:CpaD family pilus assembly lipoprotein n=1 Tax=Pelagibius marinus TaxID=2762760 RepID=UPI0018732743|nr:CpaD family pilus assembly lipoprotein [Pelagibius marinus]
MLSHKKTRLSALFCLGLATAGCAGDPDRDPGAQKVADAINTVFYNGKWQQIPATPENQAETIIFEQRVSFAGDGAVLDRRARRAIDRLLAESEPTPNSLIGLSVADSVGAPATFDRLTLQRLEAVRLVLADRGYQSALATTAEARVAPLDDGEVGLTVTKVMAILPDCDQPQPLEPNTPDFNRGFGCSNAYNLGVMVADPADLERGRVLEPADAERHGMSVLRYRVGKDEPLQEEDTNSK